MDNECQVLGKHFDLATDSCGPGADIGTSFPIAVIRRTEFSIPVVRSGKAEGGLGRLLCSGGRGSTEVEISLP
jgi:hypothetical protein